MTRPLPPLRLPSILLAGCAALVVLGSPGPWATAFSLSIDGMATNGAITLALGAFSLSLTALLLLRSGGHRVSDDLVALPLAAAGAIGLYDWLNLDDVTDDGGLLGLAMRHAADVDWGLQLVTIGGLGAVVVVALSLGWHSLRRLTDPAP